MKKPISFRNLSLIFAVSVLFLSCKSDDDSAPTVDFSMEYSRMSIQVDQAVDGVLHIIETAYVEREEISGTSDSFFPVCTTVTTSVAGSETTITLDFGQGCALPNGALASGSVELNYGPVLNENRTISYSFHSFSYEQEARRYGISGNGDLVRMLNNSNGNPQSTINGSMTLGLPNSMATATVNGLRIIEWVEGLDNTAWSDNVYHISGNWNTNFSPGFIRSASVLENLVKKATCPLIVSGKMEITQEGFTAVLDYGNGNCDESVTYTINGKQYPIDM